MLIFRAEKRVTAWLLLTTCKTAAVIVISLFVCMCVCVFLGSCIVCEDQSPPAVPHIFLTSVNEVAMPTGADTFEAGGKIRIGGFLLCRKTL